MSRTGLSRASDLYGYWKCRYDIGNIIDPVLQGILRIRVRLAFVGHVSFRFICDEKLSITLIKLYHLFDGLM